MQSGQRCQAEVARRGGKGEALIRGGREQDGSLASDIDAGAENLSSNVSFPDARDVVMSTCVAPTTLNAAHCQGAHGDAVSIWLHGMWARADKSELPRRYECARGC